MPCVKHGRRGMEGGWKGGREMKGNEGIGTLEKVDCGSGRASTPNKDGPRTGSGKIRNLSNICEDVFTEI